MSVSHRIAKSTTAPNGATASVAQWRKPWGIAERFGLSSPVAGGRIDGADELCRPIRGCGVLMLAMFPGLTPLGYVTTAPFGAKNGNPSFHPTHHTANPAHRPCLPSPPALSQVGEAAACLTFVSWEREPKPGRNRRRVEVRWHAISALKHGVMLKRSHRRTQPSAHAEATSKCEREPLNSEATKAPNGATANIAQGRKPWGS